MSIEGPWMDIRDPGKCSPGPLIDMVWFSYTLTGLRYQHKCLSHQSTMQSLHQTVSRSVMICTISLILIQSGSLIGCKIDSYTATHFMVIHCSNQVRGWSEINLR